MNRRRRRFRSLKSVPVLPSMVTLGNLFCGFLAMAKVADAVTLAGRSTLGYLDPQVVATFEFAALLVFAAMVFDGLDGAVARLTHQATPFGAQLDSLADVVTFGVAPAFLTKVLIDAHAQMPNALLPDHPKLYYVAAAIYVLCAAMRLARFNVESSGPADDDHKEFAGLPSPAAAAVICSLIAFFCAPDSARTLISDRLLPDATKNVLLAAMPIVLALVGLLMVSRFPYPHLVAMLVRGRHSFPFLVAIVVLVAAAAVEWQFVLATLTLLYVASGILIGAYRLVTTGRLDRRAPTDDDDDDDDGYDVFASGRMN